jgi:hypothetical protein
VEEKFINFVGKLQKVLFHTFPKVMESLEEKWRRLNIMDGEDHLVDGSLFTTCVFSKNYGVNLHTNSDDDGVCFIILLREGISSNLG